MSRTDLEISCYTPDPDFLAEFFKVRSVARAHVVYDRDRSGVISSLSNVAIAVGVEKSLKSQKNS